VSNQLLEEIRKLSAAERMQLVEEIWLSLTPEELPPPSEEQLKELDRRAARSDADPDRGIPWEQVKQRAERELRGLK